MSESKYVKGLDAEFDKSVDTTLRHIQKKDFNAGVIAERERIIKLLEGIAIVTKNNEVAVMELLSAIVELIKGENK